MARTSYRCVSDRCARRSRDKRVRLRTLFCRSFLGPWRFVNGRALLIAVGIEPESVCEIDANEAGWLARVGRGAFVVTDAVIAAELPDGCQIRVFRVVADSSLDELEQLCGHCDGRKK